MIIEIDSIAPLSLITINVGLGLLFVGVLGFALFILIGILTKIPKKQDKLFGTSAIFFMIAVFSLVPFISSKGEVYEIKSDRQTQAIADLGFEEVQVSGNTVTASDNGSYFKGGLLEIEVDRWMLVDYAEIERKD